MSRFHVKRFQMLDGRPHIAELMLKQSRDVQAEAGSRSGGSGPFSVEAKARKSYRFRFHIGYLIWRVNWRKSFVHFPMWIKR